MSFKMIASAAVLLLSATPALAEGGVIVTPNRIQAGDVVITQDRIVVPGVDIQSGTRVAPGVKPQEMRAAPTSDYTNADLNGMDFKGQNLRNARFVNATLENVNFENADLRGADFTNADLKNANLTGANLEGANLTNATLSGTHMVNANLKNAILTNVDMSEAITVKKFVSPEITQGVTPAAKIQEALVQRAPGVPTKIDLTVNFDFNSDQLTSQGREQVTQILEAIRGMNGADILVQGHTDNVGSDQYNQKLSDRRAQAVVRELQLSRLSDVDLIAKGYGEAEPIATNDSNLGRAQNRRVTLVNVTKAR